VSPNATESVIEQLKRTVPPPRTRAQAQSEPAPAPAPPAFTFTALEPAPAKIAPPAAAAPSAATANEERIAVRIPERKTQTARKRCSFDLDAALAEEFKVACVLAGVEMREVVASLVQGFVASHRAK
jgi:hypothetical protein